ncbi:MAG: DUF5719 family protein [Acidimicrobiales bacterium]
MSDAVRRALLLVGVVVVLVAVGLAGTGTTAPAVPGGVGDASASATTVTPAGAESSAWFCSGSTGTAGVAPGALLLANATPRPVTGTATTLTAAAAGPPVPFTARARAQTVAQPGAAISGSAMLGSSLVLSGGGVGITQVMGSPLGATAAACASRTSRRWYFADASTSPGDTVMLSLFNPTDTIAVVDVSFVSAAGVLAPPAYQGVDLAGDTMVDENVGVHVPGVAHFATVVTTLSGAVVATEVQTAGQAGDGGASTTLGAASPAAVWSFAENTDVPSGSTVFHLFNPSSTAARVTVRFGFSRGAAEPLVVVVPADGVEALSTDKVTRIPRSTAFAATFVTARSTGIVVDRQVVAPPGSAAPEQGTTAGVPGGSDRWLLPAADVPAMGVASLAVVDLGRRPVAVTLTTLSGVPQRTVAGFDGRTVRPDLPLVVVPAAGSAIGSVPLELRASGPVAVEMDATPAGSPGVSVLPVLPLR